MRVAFLTHYTTMYGANRSLLSLLDGLSATDIQPLVVLPPAESLESGLHTELQNRSVPWIAADVPLHFATTAKLPSLKHPIQRRRWKATKIQEIDRRTSTSSKDLMPKLQSQSVELVYSNSSATRLGQRLADALQVPHVWHLREFAENYGMHLAHGIDDFREQLASATEVIAISNAVATRLAGKQLAAKCNVIYNGVGFPEDFEKLWERRQSRNPNAEFQFLLLGQILPSKGHEQAIDACKILANDIAQPFKLRVVGSGQSEWLTKLLAESNCGDRVEVLGPTDDPYSEIISADCLLMCSPLEAMGRVTAEAMVAGCPVIGLDACGTSELIDHEQTGLLYQGGGRQLANAMKTMILDNDLRNRMTQRAYDVAKTRFSNHTYADQVGGVIKQATNAGKRKRV